MSVLEESRPFAQQLSNVYFTILSLFCFKLFVKISLAILSHFYIVKGNRKEAARIAAEFYGVTQGQGMLIVTLSCFKLSLTIISSTVQENITCFLYGLFQSEYFVNFWLRKIFVNSPSWFHKKENYFAVSMSGLIKSRYHFKID